MKYVYGSPVVNETSSRWSNTASRMAPKSPRTLRTAGSGSWRGGGGGGGGAAAPPPRRVRGPRAPPLRRRPRGPALPGGDRRRRGPGRHGLLVVPGGPRPGPGAPRRRGHGPAPDRPPSRRAARDGRLRRVRRRLPRHGDPDRAGTPVGPPAPRLRRGPAPPPGLGRRRGRLSRPPQAPRRGADGPVDGRPLAPGRAGGAQGRAILCAGLHPPLSSGPGRLLAPAGGHKHGNADGRRVARRRAGAAPAPAAAVGGRRPRGGGDRAAGAPGAGSFFRLAFPRPHPLLGNPIFVRRTA